ncbi:MAG: hemolysin, partial [Planctomycetes bacterium]|nr:hemolysin [Planctomycetota bacterium]
DLGGPNAGTPWTDAFLARYSAAGNRLWIRQFGTSGTDKARALAPDDTGGAMVAGYTGGSLGGAYAGRGDVFLARYDSAGNQLWIRQFGTDRTDKAFALAPDGAGGVMIAGETTGSLGGPSAGFWDVFLARYDSAGNQLWISQFGSSSTDVARALAPDGAGGVMVAGWTDGGLGGPNAGDSADVFLARYDSAGNELWIRQFGTRGWDEATGLTPDGAGGVIVTGRIYVSTGVWGTRVTLTPS